MSLFGLIRKQFIDVIEWAEEGVGGTLMFRYPMEDQEIQNGGSLVVRETQLALLVNEGEIADLFEPGTHSLSTKNLPVLTSLKNWDKLFKSPFKSDVYFFSTKEQLDQKWGTASPINIRDKEFGPIRVRAFGTYSYKVKNPKAFFKKVAGNTGLYLTGDLEGQLRSAVMTSLASFFGTGAVAFLDMAANQTKFSETLKTALAQMFTDYGLELSSFFVQSVSLPEELQAHLDKVTAMNMVGDLRKYAQFQVAEGLDSVGKNGGDGNLASAGMSMGAGVAMGQVLSQALTGAGVGAGAAAGSAQPEEDPIKTIDRMHELFKKGVLTEEEFNAKKQELLKRIK